MDEVLALRLDIATFLFVAVLMTGIVALVIRRKHRTSSLPRRMSVIVLLVAAISIVAALRAGERERGRLVEMVSGIAPTYALIANEYGLHDITVQTAADDPTYLRLVELEKRLLRVNPSVADIYTLTKLPNGDCAFLVDSETDYNHNGVIDDDREERTAIGEVYDDPDFVSHMNLALAGQSVFMSEISTDRWGTWVSAIEPVRDQEGKIYAVLGVDFAASRWTSSILSVRGRYLLIGVAMTAIVLIAAFMISKLQAEVNRRESAESAARASENRLRLIVDNEPECVVVLDPDGSITEINPAGVALLSRDGLSPLGRRIQAYVSASQSATLDRHLATIFAGAPGAIELQIEHGDLPTSWLDSHCVPLRDATGHVTSVLLVARDVTARRRAEAEKEELQRQLVDTSRMAGMAEIATGVLHNVGNVLNSVNVSACMIAEKLRSSRLSSFGKLLEIVRAEQHRFGTFVTDDPRGQALPAYLQQLHNCLAGEQESILNEVTQLNAGIEHIKQVVQMQQTSAARSSTVLLPIEPTSIMEDAIKVNLISMERHRVNVERDYESDLPPLPLDKHKILQILINLISNAKRAICDPTIAHRRLTVSVTRSGRGETLEFRVRDNGVGVAPGNLPMLFRQGFTTHSDGHGFGLHSSANAATEMNGSLRCESEGPGKGATFILTVPITSSALEVAA